MVLISLFVPALESATGAVRFSFKAERGQPAERMFSPLGGNFKRKEGKRNRARLISQNEKRALRPFRSISA
ncbi:hypothetical protein [Shinella sp. M27]|uniref:hypothetical protein n=1 Tax=Shinella sp. M27 TaxID=3368614 RepID=UPI003BA2BEEF